MNSLWFGIGLTDDPVGKELAMTDRCFQGWIGWKHQTSRANSGCVVVAASIDWIDLFSIYWFENLAAEAAKYPFVTRYHRIPRTQEFDLFWKSGWWRRQWWPSFRKPRSPSLYWVVHSKSTGRATGSAPHRCKYRRHVLRFSANTLFQSGCHGGSSPSDFWIRFRSLLRRESTSQWSILHFQSDVTTSVRCVWNAQRQWLYLYCFSQYDYGSSSEQQQQWSICSRLACRFAQSHTKAFNVSSCISITRWVM